MICDATAVSVAGSITTATLASASDNPTLGDKSSSTELLGRVWGYVLWKWSEGAAKAPLTLGVSTAFNKESSSAANRKSLLLTLTIQNALLPLAIATQCYFTDGSATLAEQQPCFPDKINGPCCGINKSNGDPNDICLTNGLCLAQVSPYTGLILLNACTDPTWESNDCPSICPKSIQGSYGIHVLPCPEISLDHWCCSANGSDCCADAFKLKMGMLMLSNTSSAVPTPTGAANTGVASTTTTVFITEHATAKADPSSDSGCTDSKTLVVGVSIGVGLGACLITLLGTMWSQRRRYKRRLQEKPQFGVNCIPNAQLPSFAQTLAKVMGNAGILPTRGDLASWMIRQTIYTSTLQVKAYFSFLLNPAECFRHLLTGGQKCIAYGAGPRVKVSKKAFGNEIEDLQGL
ncbi:hypothetical protein CDV55_106968 [Aspergillus turcosus]|nr:hypothetical protein CDV55_106968 [Aspergillus turcosus]